MDILSSITQGVSGIGGMLGGLIGGDVGNVFSTIGQVGGALGGALRPIPVQQPRYSDTSQVQYQQPPQDPKGGNMVLYIALGLGFLGLAFFAIKKS